MAEAPRIDLSGLHLGFGKGLPLFLQTEASECGLACLAMIASYHGYRTDLATLRRRFPTSLKGATLGMLTEVADKIELTSRPLRLELNELPQLKCPAILHWDLNHFLVLKEADENRVIVHDPALGVRTLTLPEVSRHFTGVALELEPSIRFKKREDRQTLHLRGLMGKVRGLKRSMLQILLLALSLEVFTIVGPFFTQWVVDEVLVSGDQDLLTILAIGFGLIALIRVTVSALRSWVVIHMSTQLRLQWFANVFAHLVKLPMAYFEHRYVGDVVSRFESIHKIQRTLTTSFIEAILDGLMAITTLTLMLIYSPLLSAVVGVGVAVYGLLRMLRYHPLRNATEAQIVNEAKQDSHFLETIRGIQSIKLFNRHEDRRSHWLTLVVDTTNCEIHVQKLNLIFKSMNGLIFGLETVLVMWLGARAVLNQELSVGMLLAFISYKDQFVTRISSLIDKWYEVKMLRLYGERLADIVLTEPDQETESGFLATPDIAPAITLENVSFRYGESEQLVLKDLNLAIKAGEFTAIIGPSGCGKTTLLKIMLGLLHPTSGTVRIGSVDIKQLGIQRYRSMIGAVMQEDQLFAGSIADNICFFDPNSDQAWIEECAKMAAVHNDIVAMPMAYNTLIGDMGTALSGGQKQRILLARALYKRPSILFLDEATSHLDIELERMVNQSVSQLNLTRVMIAHRPQTIAMAQRIIRLGERIVELQLRPTNLNQSHRIIEGVDFDVFTGGATTR
jgi:ATP-binding cassette subfamily B protein RaxB